MKRIKWILSFLMITSIANVHAEDGKFNLSVTSDGKIILKRVQMLNADGYESTLKDVAKECTFTNTVNRYGVYMLSVSYLTVASKKTNSINIQLFLKPGDTRLIFQGSEGKYSITGVSASAQKDYELLASRDQVVLKRGQVFESRLRQYEQSKNKKAAAQMKDSIAKAQMARKGLYESYIRQHPNDELSLYAMGMYNFINRENPMEIKSLLSTLGKELQDTEEMMAIKKDAEENEKFLIGAKAPDFTQTDTNGVAVSLTSLQGKYVLVDFWASWCKPCRAQNPSLLRLYQKYNDKGFTILGISLDSKKDAWLKAIHNDKLEWQQVSDLNLWKNAVAKQYKITYVPQNYLLDTRGVIIGKNLNEDELNEVLEKELTHKP
jgi:peroxiredoxin